MANAGKALEKLRPSCTFGRNVNHSLAVESSLAVPEKVAHQYCLTQVMALLARYIPLRIQITYKAWAHVFLAPLFIIAKVEIMQKLISWWTHRQNATKLSDGMAIKKGEGRTGFWPSSENSGNWVPLSHIELAWVPHSWLWPLPIPRHCRHLGVNHRMRVLSLYLSTKYSVKECKHWVSSACYTVCADACYNLCEAGK